tara:strand:+ start:5019 stop:5459 length:441 start_codon:yes stop_codon:yes gene_type:complete
MKRKAPEKQCPDCGEMCHARRSSCKDCGFIFFKKKQAVQEELAKNWRNLKAGDVIKCIAGSGTYYASKDKEGEKIMMGQKGMFEVVEIHDENKRSCGIIGRKIFAGRVRSSYREYIYMGEPYFDKAFSLHKRPHKIRVIKLKEESV